MEKLWIKVLFAEDWLKVKIGKKDQVELIEKDNLWKQGNCRGKNYFIQNVQNRFSKKKFCEIKQAYLVDEKSKIKRIKQIVKSG